jgi:hypothetical protein
VFLGTAQKPFVGQSDDSKGVESLLIPVLPSNDAPYRSHHVD